MKTPIILFSSEAFGGESRPQDNPIPMFKCRSSIVSDLEIFEFGEEKHRLVTCRQFLENPEKAISEASLQDFTLITPQYPGLRSALPQAALTEWISLIGPTLAEIFDLPTGSLTATGWHSLVTLRPSRLAPIQRLPHVDGLEANQIAMMLYLHRTPHGGTAFFRHRATGYESLSAERYPAYKKTLEAEVAERGLPPSAYPSDGAPHFERIHVGPGEFNQAIFYRGNIFHSGVIDQAAPLDADPRRGRYTINAFIRPA